ncbi:MAG: HAMP domain-containing sensor histidine kinase, partial [bacterium]|nr:HAMP domain-containing sensor histidine kinase [bacterium]
SAVRTVESTHLLQESLRDLRKNLETHFTCRPAEWIEKTAAEYAAEGRPVSHDCVIGPDAAGRIRPAEFAQILDNLVRNGLRAAPDGEIKIIFHGNADLLFVDVEDNGPGVPEPVREKLFAERVTTRKSSGGFGLYHAARVVKKYGGEMRLVETGEGKTVFQIQLKRVDNA